MLPVQLLRDIFKPEQTYQTDLIAHHRHNACHRIVRVPNAHRGLYQMAKLAIIDNNVHQPHASMDLAKNQLSLAKSASLVNAHQAKSVSHWVSHMLLKALVSLE